MWWESTTVGGALSTKWVYRSTVSRCRNTNKLLCPPMPVDGMSAVIKSGDGVRASKAVAH